MIRKGTVSLEEVIPFIKDNSVSRITLLGESVGVSSVRLQTFAVKGLKCVCCDIIGEFFAVEKHHVSDVSYHINLYGYNKNGKEVLMTRDHIVAKSNGGFNGLQNMQPMCSKCNGKKGDQDFYVFQETKTSSLGGRKKKQRRNLEGNQALSPAI